MYLTFRVGKVNREVRGETQKSLAEMSAVTEETLSVSGMLLSKTFGQQDAAIGRFSKLNRELARLQVRQAMVGRWFFMIIGTIFSITPAFVYWLAGYLAIQGDPTRPDDRRHRRVHDAPEPAVLPARPAAQRPGRDPGRAGAVRPDLRVPRDGPRDRRRARRGRRSTARRSAAASDSATSRSATRRRAGAGCRAPRRGRGGADDGRRARRPIVPRPIRSHEPSRSGSRTSTSRSSPASWSRSSGPSGSGKTTTTYLVPRLYDVDAGAVEIDGVDIRDGHAGEPRRRDRLRDPGDVPVPRHDPREPALRASPTRPTRSSRRRRAPRRSTSGSASSPRATTRSSASAATSCRAARSSGSRSPGCCSRIPRILILDEATSAPRHRERAADPGRARAAHGGPHDDRHRPPPVDDPARRPDPRLRARPHRRARHARRAARPRAGSTPGCTASSSCPSHPSRRRRHERRHGRRHERCHGGGDRGDRAATMRR